MWNKSGYLTAAPPGRDDVTGQRLTNFKYLVGAL